MTAIFFDPERVPVAAMPAAVASAVDEARQLRGRYRDAQAAAAHAQAALEAQETADVQAAATAIRAGAPAPAASTGIKRRRDELEKATRAASALSLAAESAAMDTTETIRSASAEWQASLDAELEQARGRAIDALDAFAHELAVMRAAAGAALWIRGAVEDGRFDRPARMPLVGAAAPSSSRRTSNAQPLSADELVAYLREVVEPTPAPAVAAVSIVEPATSDAT